MLQLQPPDVALERGCLECFRQKNKFEQVFSDEQEMSPVGGGRGGGAWPGLVPWLGLGLELELGPGPGPGAGAGAEAGAGAGAGAGGVPGMMWGRGSGLVLERCPVQ